MANDPLSAFLSGQERGTNIQAQQFNLQQARQAAPQQAAQRDINLQRQKIGLGQEEIGQSVQQANLISNSIDALVRLPFQQRMGTAQQLRQGLSQVGINLPEFTEADLTDQALAGHKASLTGFAQDPQGTISQLTAGQREFESLTSGLEPAEQERARRIKLGLDPRAALAAEEFGARETSKLEAQRGVKAEIAGEVSGAQQRSKSQESRTQGFINDGITAAENLPTIKRSLELLDTVKTGGFAAAALRAKQTLGVEGADEGELSANLGKAILSQMRSTFGAAFTEREGDKLDRIEANFSKSPGTNKRLLNNLKTILEREARRGIDAAEKAGDEFGAQEIRDLLTFQVGEQQQQQPQQQGVKFLGFE